MEGWLDLGCEVGPAKAAASSEGPLAVRVCGGGVKVAPPLSIVRLRGRQGARQGEKMGLRPKIEREGTAGAVPPLPVSCCAFPHGSALHDHACSAVMSSSDLTTLITSCYASGYDVKGVVVNDPMSA